MTRHLLITIFLISGYQITFGQIKKTDYSSDLYYRTLNYYVDSAINKIYHWDNLEWTKFPKEYQYVKYLIVADKSITYKLPDTLQRIIWTKITPFEFCNYKRLKDYRNVIFINPVQIQDSLISIWIYEFYGKNKNCDITFDVGYNFIYLYDKLKFDLIKIDSRVMVIK